jgi:hypothetical protein
MSPAHSDVRGYIGLTLNKNSSLQSNKQYNDIY